MNEDPIEKMFEQCDIQIWCESDEGELFCMMKTGTYALVLIILENDHTEDFRELLGSQNTILDTENTNIEEECIVEQNSKIVSEIKKQEKKKKSKKFKINMKKAGFIMILLFCIVFGFFWTFYCIEKYKCRQKEAAFNKRNTERKGYNTGNNADSN